MKTRYTMSCAALALLSAGAARAADATTGGSDAMSTAVSEVVVSAQRRDESVEKVPMTVQAFGKETISRLNIETLDDLVKFTPNVTFGKNGPGQGVIFMRGLSAGLQGNQSSATIATFPNVALYLDDQSMQFPAHNVDIYAVDLERIEVLEGPQGTLFGGGAEAGAVRYITNKPNTHEFSGYAEGSYGWTAQGASNAAGQITLNIPVVQDKLAVRLVAYNDHHGGYIDNVPSTFTRSNEDLGNTYWNITPNGQGVCPNGLPAGGPQHLCALPQSVAPQANNNSVAGKDWNPVDYAGARASVLWQVNDDWDVLIQQSFSSLREEGLSAEYPVGSDFQPLKPLQITAFSPSFDHDRWYNTSWTVNGKLGPLKAIYTGGWMDRHIDQQADYTNYSRSTGGEYYACTGGGTGFGNLAPVCYSPVTSWRDVVHSTHFTSEVRLSTPDDWRLRAIGGAFYEQFKIYDNMNFNYKTVPSCTPQNLALALAGGPTCVANTHTAPGSTANFPGERGDTTAFGEDTQRGYDQTALFISVDYDLIPNVLTITGGTRWYQYKEFEVGSQYGTDTGCTNVPNGQCGALVNIDAANDHVTYSGFRSRANVTWHVTPSTLAYFTFSQGFRPGGFNRSVSNVAKLTANGPAQFRKPNGYAPDSLTNYEIGLKTALLDHRVVVNLSAYYMQWDNVQLLFFNPTQLGNTTFGVNGPNYTIKGAEFQINAKVTEGLSVMASGSYNDARQANSPCLVDNIAGTPAFGQCITQVFTKGVGVVPFQNPFGAVGSTPPFSPKFQGAVNARYDWEIDNYKAFVQGSINYTGSMFNQPATYASGAGVVVPSTTLLRYEMPAYTTFDASIGISKDNWTVQLVGQNLGNSHASTFTSSTQFILEKVPLRPRVVSIKVGAHF
ncbi:MAG TPA: TonB-dependent receptor [Caulobacteraceae bacterium]|nr:TonB-dependent receptor [Caulobacteraceae bacterium]